MMKRQIFGCAALFCAITGYAHAETLRMGLITPPTHEWTKSARALAEAFHHETSGRIKMDVFPAGQLGNEAQIMQQLQSGALDLAFMTVGEMTYRDPAFGALTAPYLVANGKEAAHLLEGPTAMALLDRLDAMGLVGLDYGMAGMRIVLLSKATPLGENGTVAGRKIRTVPLAQELDFWRFAGTIPTPLPLTDLYDAYSNGQIDGMQIDFEGAYKTRFYELTSDLLDTEHMIFPMVAVASKRKWQNWSADDKALVTRLVVDQARHLREIYPKIDDDYRHLLQEAGVSILRPGPEVFGSAVTQWDHVWAGDGTVITHLRQEAQNP